MTHRVHRLRRRGRSTQQIRIGLALRQVVGRRKTERRHLLVFDVVADGIKFERGKRPKYNVDVVALDQLLRFDLGACGIAARIGGDEIHLAAAAPAAPPARSARRLTLRDVNLRCILVLPLAP